MIIHRGQEEFRITAGKGCTAVGETHTLEAGTLLFRMVVWDVSSDVIVLFFLIIYIFKLLYLFYNLYYTSCREYYFC